MGKNTLPLIWLLGNVLIFFPQAAPLPLLCYMDGVHFVGEALVCFWGCPKCRAKFRNAGHRKTTPYQTHPAKKCQGWVLKFCQSRVPCALHTISFHTANVAAHRPQALSRSLCSRWFGVARNGQSCSPALFRIRLQEFFSGYSRLGQDGVKGRTLDRSMIGHGQWCASPVRVLSYHRDMVTFPDKMKSKPFQGPDNFPNRRIHRES